MAHTSKYKVFTLALLVCAASFVIISSARSYALPACDTRDAASLIAERFVRNDPTFNFDGLKDTLSLRVEHVGGLDDFTMPKLSGLTVGLTLPLEPKEYTFKAKFDSRHSGYGDRTGKYLAQVITPHEAEITVSNCQVKSAVMDGKWDMVKGELIA